MILARQDILKAISDGDIFVKPFNPDNVSVNSIDLTLNNKLLVYNDPVLSVREKNATSEITIPESGYILQPNQLYIASVNEFTNANGYVGVVYGKSSLGRLGLFAHICAGYVDNGYAGNITLELAVIKPLKVFPNMKVCQIAYYETTNSKDLYSGKYMGDTTPQASKSFKDFKNE
jgi:dCTP deaminase